MSDTYILKLCKLCADMVLGMILVKVSPAEEIGKCEFCKKKKPVNFYRVTVIPKGDKDGQL